MARKKKDDEPAPDTFVVLFAALSILILAFFILLNSIATMDEKRTRTALASVVGTFGVMPGSQPINLTMNTIDDEVTRQVVDKWMEKWKERAGYTVSDAMKKVIASVSLQDDIGMDIEGDDLRLTFPAAIAFNAGETELSPEAQTILSAISELSVGLRSNLIIEGHASDDESQDAWRISAWRGSAAARFLVEFGGVPAEMLTVRGLGANHPANPADPAANRRVVVILKKVKPRSMLASSMDFWKTWGAKDPWREPTTSNLPEPE
ncbi:OmpA family protein [bacterium]|nr:OmpA family protein [bacterium]